MKKLTALALAFCLALSMTACTQGGTPPTSEQSPSAAPEVTLNTSVISYGTSSAWDSLMPYNSPSGSNFARIVYDKIYDRLAFVHADGTLSPRGATSWESAEDGMAAVFHLDRKAAFHDGVSVTAQSWVDTITLMTNPDCPTLGRSSFAVLAGTDDGGVAMPGNVLGAEALDDDTLKLTFKTPTTPEHFLLDKNREFYALPTHLLQDTPPAEVMALDLWNAPVGSGPCKFVSEVAGSQLVLASNPDYQLGAPGFGQFVITVMDKSNLLTSMISGDLDFYAIGGTVSSEDAEMARAAGLTVNEDTVATTFYELMLNSARIPDARLRRAIEFALDKELLCQQNTQGLGVVTDGDVLPGSPDATQTVVRPRDLEGAKALLAEAGYEGQTYKLACPSNRAGLAALMQQNLAEAGINTAIETVDSATMFSGMADGTYDLGIASHTPGVLPLWFVESRFTENNNIFHIQEMAPYTTQIAAIKAETDPAARKVLVQEFQTFLMTERPFIPLWFTAALRVQSSTVEGIEAAAASFSNENVWDWVKASDTAVRK